jgi:hypothetical protein
MEFLAFWTSVKDLATWLLDFFPIPGAWGICRKFLPVAVALAAILFMLPVTKELQKLVVAQPPPILGLCVLVGILFAIVVTLVILNVCNFREWCLYRNTLTPSHSEVQERIARASELRLSPSANSLLRLLDFEGTTTVEKLRRLSKSDASINLQLFQAVDGSEQLQPIYSRGGPAYPLKLHGSVAGASVTHDARIVWQRDHPTSIQAFDATNCSIGRFDPIKAVLHLEGAEIRFQPQESGDRNVIILCVPIHTGASAPKIVVCASSEMPLDILTSRLATIVLKDLERTIPLLDLRLLNP